MFFISWLACSVHHGDVCADSHTPEVLEEQEVENSYFGVERTQRTVQSLHFSPTEVTLVYKDEYGNTWQVVYLVTGNERL